MQFRPRLTGASGRPQATTRPRRVPTRTPQPVPQKNGTALYPINGFLLTNNGAGNARHAEAAAAAAAARC